MAVDAILPQPELVQVSVITGDFPGWPPPPNRCPTSTPVTYGAGAAARYRAQSHRYTVRMTLTCSWRRLRCTGLVLLMAACLGWGSATAQAQTTPAPSPTAGLVKRASGVVTVSRASVTLPVQPGLIIQVGDTFRTGPDGAVALALADDTLLSVGPDSELQVTAFNFDSTTQDGNLLASVWRGTVAFVTGLIAKKAPESVRVQTRTVVLGVRGTEFIVDAGRGAP